MRSKKKHEFTRVLLLGVAIIVISMIASVTKHLNASFKTSKVSPSVSIDGTDYGVFDSIEGLEEAFLGNKGSFTKITLKRQFVTAKSLSHWARKSTDSRQKGKRNLKIEFKNEMGETIRSLELAGTVPLAWTVESNDVEQGGFLENIDLAVEEVRVR